MTDVRPRHRRPTLRDIAFVLAISATLLGARFAVSGGKAILCADSLQYADNAMALTDPHLSADFAFRKPGYSFLLAVVWAAFGSLGWPAILTNYLLLCSWPMGAFVLAWRISRHRVAAWLAALITLASLTAFPWADRLMSECLYGTLLLAALILAAECLEADTARPTRLLPVGVAAAMAWMTRSSGASLVGAILILVAWRTWSTKRLMMRAGAALLGPVCLAAVVECGLNATEHGAFRPCTGTLGPMMLMRACALQGDPLTEGPSASACAALLPERQRDEAFVRNNLDVWVARDRAIRQAGLTEWQADHLFAQAAREVIASRPGDYLKTSLHLFGHSCLRRPLSAGCVAPQRTAGLVPHPLAASDEDYEQHWFAYWALSHRTNDDALNLAKDLDRQSSVRASFTSSEPFATLRYAYMRFHVARGVASASDLLRLWPLLAVPLCLWLCPGRRAAAIVGAALAADAVLVALTAPSIDAFQRFNDVWLPADSAFAGAAWVMARAAIVRWFRTSTFSRNASKVPVADFSSQIA